MRDAFEIAIAYAPKHARGALRALWDYDAMLGRIVATTTEPMIGQMRLTWWHERVMALDAGEVPAEPVLVALGGIVRGGKVTSAELAGLVEGWEALLEPLPLNDAALEQFASKRGDRLFALTARLSGDNIEAGIGRGWALVDFAIHCSDEVSAFAAWQMAGATFRTTRIAGLKMLRILATVSKMKAAASFADIHKPVSRISLLRAVLQ